MSGQVADYACPECGYDGPHPVLSAGDVWPSVVECGDTACAAEFVADPGEPDPTNPAILVEPN